MADENWQSFKGIHPEYYMKWLAQQRPIYAGQIAAAPLPIQPVARPSMPSIPTEVQMRILQANNRIYPDQPKSVYIPPPPTNATGIQPTNPDIIENINMRERKWYPEPYIPYVGWPNRLLQTGIQV